jgi:hypothetical protein
LGRGLVAGICIAFLTAAVATAAVLWHAGERSAAPSEDAGVFVTRIVGFIAADRYGRAWPSLNPAHQLVAQRAEYISCERRSPVGSTLRSAAVLRTTQRLRRVPGVAGNTPVTAVTLRLVIRDRVLGIKRTFVHTFNAVADGSRWTWILTPSRYRLYSSDACFV